jgi:hypothetical protein
VHGSLELSRNVNDMADIGKTHIMYKLRICNGRYPENPLRSTPVLPRPRGASRKRMMP